MNLSLQEIELLLQEKNLNQVAHDLLNNHAISAIDMDTTYRKDVWIMSATVKDQKQYEQVHVAVEKEDHSVSSFHCSCKSFQTTKEICEHCGCVILHFFQNYLTETSSQPAIENIAIATLLANYHEKTNLQTSIFLKNQQALLIPILTISNDKVEFTLLLKLNKEHLIKDIPSWIHDVEIHTIRNYGNDKNFIHHPLNFHIQSRELLQFLLEHKTQFQYSKKATSTTFSTITLTSPTLIDQFFSFMKDRHILYYVDKKMFRKIAFKQQKPNRAIEITHVDQTYQIKLQTPYLCWSGKQYAYFFDYYQIYYVKHQHFPDCLQILDLLKEPLFITYKQLQELSQELLIHLNHYMEIQGWHVLDVENVPITYEMYIDIHKKHLKIHILQNVNQQSYQLLKEDETSFYRNIEVEQNILQKLTEYISYTDRKHGFMYIEKEGLIYRFLKQGIYEFQTLCRIFTNEKFYQLNRKLHYKIGVQYHHNLLNLSLENSIFSLSEWHDILQAYQQKKQYYRLKDGNFLSLEEEQVQQEIKQLKRMLPIPAMKQDSTIQIPLASFIYLMQQNPNLQLDKECQQYIDEIQKENQAPYVIYPSKQYTLRNYQKDGIAWLHHLTKLQCGGILADDMGLGKTVQVIAYLQNEQLRNHSIKTCIVCPSSLLYNWEKEFQKFSTNIKVTLLHGEKQKRTKILKDIESYDVLITSYEFLKREISTMEKISFTYCFLDEAHYIKNHSSKNAIACKQIQAKHRFALTGTPIENYLSELWSIFDFVMPSYLYDYATFKKYYEIPIVKYQDQELLEELRYKCSPFLLRRLKKEVLKELPSKIEHTIFLEFNQDMKALYDTNVAAAKQQLLPLENENLTTMHILALLNNLRIFCCHPPLLYDDVKAPFVKLEACLELIETCIHAKKKILLFSQFTSVFSYIEQELNHRQISYFTLKGSTPKHLRQEMVEAFQNDDTPIFLISLKAGGVGLNLTKAEVVIHFDIWWNVMLQNQATDRAYRIGQKKDVQVYHFIMKDTIEEKMLELQKKKLDLYHSIMDDGSQSLKTLTKQELLELFDV